jgi:hypothetical protein
MSGGRGGEGGGEAVRGSCRRPPRSPEAILGGGAARGSQAVRATLLPLLQDVLASAPLHRRFATVFAALGEHCVIPLLWCPAFEPWMRFEPCVLMGLVCPSLSPVCTVSPCIPPSPESRPWSRVSRSCRCRCRRQRARSYLSLLPFVWPRMTVTPPPFRPTVVAFDTGMRMRSPSPTQSHA